MSTLQANAKKASLEVPGMDDEAAPLPPSVPSGRRMSGGVHGRNGGGGGGTRDHTYMTSALTGVAG